jgi:hypothetical protein
MQSINHPRQESTAPNETASRLRTVTGNRFPRKCSCGCGHAIPRDPQSVSWSTSARRARTPPTSASTRPTSGATAARPHPTRAARRGPRVHSRDRLLADQDEERVRSPPFGDDPAHTEADASPSPEAGRPWASGQLVFNAGQFESARSGFADYAKDGETAAQLRTRVNRVILEDLEQKVLALRALHAKLRDLDAGASFGDVVARARPRSDRECAD